VIRGFFHRLPEFVDVETRVKAEAHLARLAGEHRPDELAKLADKLTDCLNPDGDFTDTDRARRRGLTLGRQDTDGMSPITGYLTPEARATLDAVLAKLAAPGMCNPDDEAPCVSGAPSEHVAGNNTRTAGQRNHDGWWRWSRWRPTWMSSPSCVQRVPGPMADRCERTRWSGLLRGVKSGHRAYKIARDHLTTLQVREMEAASPYSATTSP
jgi:Domain of unknown function (DUF222)